MCFRSSKDTCLYNLAIALWDATAAAEVYYFMVILPRPNGHIKNEIFKSVHVASLSIQDDSPKNDI